MSSAELQETERRLAEVEALHRTTSELLAELNAYRDALQQKRAWLRDQEAPPVRTQPRPAVQQHFERRIERRRVGNPISILIANDAAEGPGSAWVMDRSLTGLGVWADAAEPVGTILNVRPAQSEDWWTQVIVKHCRQERGNWVLGCQFVAAVPWKQLRQFG